MFTTNAVTSVLSQKPHLITHAQAVDHRVVPIRLHADTMIRQGVIEVTEAETRKKSCLLLHLTYVQKIVETISTTNIYTFIPLIFQVHWDHLKHTSYTVHCTQFHYLPWILPWTMAIKKTSMGRNLHNNNNKVNHLCGESSRLRFSLYTGWVIR